MKLLTTADVAAHVGCSTGTVSRTAKKHQIGQQLGRSWVFSAGDRDQLAKLIQSGPGNPNFSAGNQEWTKREQTATKTEAPKRRRGRPRKDGAE